MIYNLPTLLKTYIRGYCHSLIIATAIKLSLPEILSDAPSTTEELALKQRLNPRMLERVLRLLECLEIVTFNNNSKWQLSDIGYYLQKNIPNSFAWEVLLLTHPQILSAWNALDVGLKKNETAYTSHFHKNFFETLKENPEMREIFQQGWRQQTKRLIPTIIEVLDLENVSHITEIAGGYGDLLRSILDYYPKLEGVLCESIHLKDKITVNFNVDHLSQRVNVLYSEALNAPFPPTDVIICKNFLHLFDDEQVLLHLNYFQKCLKKSGRIVLIERLIWPHRDLHEVLCMDIMMLVMIGGKERTLEEFKDLLKKSGLILSRSKPVNEGFYLIEGKKNE